MAIDYTLTIQGNDLTNDMLLDAMKSINMDCHSPIRRKEVLEIDEYMETLGVAIYLGDSNPAPNDTLDFHFLNKEFQYGKCLTFRLDKLFEDRDYQLETIFSIIFSVMNRLNTNAVFAFEFDTLYCFFSSSGALYLNTQTGIQTNQLFMQHASGWVCYDIVKHSPNF